MDKNENMTALMSAFARAYHTEHNEITMYSDPLAHRILGEADYTAIARNIGRAASNSLTEFQRH